jgi:hypothetical protein
MSPPNSQRTNDIESHQTKHAIAFPTLGFGFGFGVHMRVGKSPTDLLDAPPQTAKSCLPQGT